MTSTTGSESRLSFSQMRDAGIQEGQLAQAVLQRLPKSNSIIVKVSARA
jgi:hypothetical protein